MQSVGNTNTRINYTLSTILRAQLNRLLPYYQTSSLKMKRFAEELKPLSGIVWNHRHMIGNTSPFSGLKKRVSHFTKISVESAIPLLTWSQPSRGFFTTSQALLKNCTYICIYILTERGKKREREIVYI